MEDHFCTWCGKKIEDFIINITLDINSYRLTETGATEEIGNLDLKTSEKLCTNCFDKFTKIINDNMRKES